MRRTIILASLILTAIMFASGYVIVYTTSFLAMALELPGPYSQNPIAWLWVALSVLMLFVASLAFCRWLARRVERQSLTSRTFE